MKYYVVDAFTDSIFKGNPAGVCVLEETLEDGIMQQIAAENNLSETAFILKRHGYYDLRWFTPKVEIDLCGHATLASAYVVMHFLSTDETAVHFKTRSGMLTVTKRSNLYELDFAARKCKKVTVTSVMEQAIGTTILEAYHSNYDKDLILLLESEEQINRVIPSHNLIRQLASHAVTITAKGNTADFVSRFFAPNVGVLEDPVTGSSHTALIPLWADKLQKTQLTAMQLSKRGGVLLCKFCGDRVNIAGNAALYLKGELLV